MTIAKQIPSHSPPSTHLPRLLFLHGGGTNATIYRVQCRALLARLAPHFRPVFADAPFLCGPHPDVLTVYSECGPFRRWFPWLSSHLGHGDAPSGSSAIPTTATAGDKVVGALRAAMHADDEEGGTGEWVGVVGFSQGAKLAVSLLLEQQMREEQLGPFAPQVEGGCGVVGVRWRFGVLMAGRAPPVVLASGLQTGTPGLAGPDEITVGKEGEWEELPVEARIGIPTVHVHGVADPGLEQHRRLMKDYFVVGSAKLIEWSGGHRVVLKSVDVDLVTRAIFEAAHTVVNAPP